MVMTVTERAACLSTLDDAFLLTLPLHTTTTTASVGLLEIVTDLYHIDLSSIFYQYHLSPRDNASNMNNVHIHIVIYFKN